MKKYLVISHSSPGGFCLPGIVLFFVSLAAVSHAAETVLFKDSFDSGSAGQVLIGADQQSGTSDDYKLETSAVEGRAWNYLSVAGHASLVSWRSGLGVHTQRNTAAWIDLRSAGAYEKPATITISALLAIGAGAPNAGYTGLGFYTAAPEGDSWNNFVGFTLLGDGTLSLFDKSSASPFLASVKVAGFATTTSYQLKYTINTATGGLTSVLFDGKDYTSIFQSAAAGLFIDANTDFAGFFARSGNASYTGYVDDFSISTTSIPEPLIAAWLAPVLGLSLLLRLCRKRG